MPWVLNTVNGQRSYPASVGVTFYIVADDVGLAVTRSAPDDASLILGTLAVHSYGAKLEAGNADLSISPAGPVKLRQNGNDEPPVEGFLLQAKADNRVETTIIRHGDKIAPANELGALTFIWTPPQIQVQSSEKKEDLALNYQAAEREDETDDDDEDLDNTIVPGVSKSQTMGSTPHMSASRSEVIQETPTINRVADAMALHSRIGPPGLSKEISTATAVYSTAHQEQSIVTDLTKPEEPTDAEVDDTEGKSEPIDVEPQKGRHPSVNIPKSSKRQSPDLEEPNSPTTRVSKRRKIDQDSKADVTPVKTARKSATKSKKRESTIKAESTPSRTQRSTQGSAAGSTAGSPVAVKGNYEGPKPRIVLSNSTIQQTSTFVKFLKKHGGSLADLVEDGCNILCIKDGPIMKTGKLLQAVARGIPIVSEKWLMESAKASCLLPLEPYRPPDLESVWKIPQDQLFKGYTIFFTPALKTHYKAAFGDMEKLCKAVGARRVVSKKPSGKDLTDATSSIFLAEVNGDKDVPALIEAGHECYTKDFLTHSIVVGEVDLDSEQFKVKLEEEIPEKKKKGRARNN